MKDKLPKKKKKRTTSNDFNDLNKRGNKIIAKIIPA